MTSIPIQPAEITNIAEKASGNQSKSNSLFNAFTGICFYPLYRGFLEYKKISLTKPFDAENVKNIRMLIYKNGGVFKGMGYYFFGRLVPLSILELIGLTHPYAGIAVYPLTLTSLIWTYPLYVNSNLAAMNLPGTIKLSNVVEMTKIMFNKEWYKGLKYYLLSSFLMFLPFINYMSFKYESIRVAYVFGSHFGHEFRNYTEARDYLVANNLMNYGKFRYNIFIHLYNSIFGLAGLMIIYNALNPQEAEKKD